jgi:SAM-dependent methyltransferase
MLRGHSVHNFVPPAAWLTLKGLLQVLSGSSQAPPPSHNTIASLDGQATACESSGGANLLQIALTELLIDIYFGSARMSDDIDVPNPTTSPIPNKPAAGSRMRLGSASGVPNSSERSPNEIRTYLDTPATILEIGSGPGLLAEEILPSCSVRRYVLLYSSTAMHDLAQERLLRFDAQAVYVPRDFRSKNWADGLGLFDAVVTVQSVDEVRHWPHVAKLYQQIVSVTRPGGYFLMADHYATPENGRNPVLYFSREGQSKAVRDAGFLDLSPVLDEGDMALYRARRK